MVINKDIFRGYDIRGIVGTDLTVDVYYSFGRGYAEFLRRRRIKTCTVGRDNRLSSEGFSQAFIRGLNDSGIETIDLGLSLSQIVYFSAYRYLTKGTAMITASHNPKEYNGLKLGTGYSETTVTEELQELREIIQKDIFPTGQGKNRQDDIFPQYLNHVTSYFSLNKKWRLVVDAGNSTSGIFYPQIFRKLGLTVIEQNCTPDSHFPLGTPDPTDIKIPHRLADRVLAEKADLGFAYDADGDRMAVVDHTGNVHWMDIMVALFAKDVLEYLPGSQIIYNNLCSKVVPQTIESNGGIPLMWKTGHSFIKEKIKETRSPLGGELSGHFFFMDNFFGHDDAAYASLRLLSYLERKGTSLNEEVSQLLPQYISSPEIKLGCPDDVKFSLINGPVKDELSNFFPKASVNTLDGIRLDGVDFTVVIRASQNAPYITVRFESMTKEEYQEIKRELYILLKKHSQIDWAVGVNQEVLSDN